MGAVLINDICPNTSSGNTSNLNGSLVGFASAHGTYLRANPDGRVDLAPHK